MPNEIVGRIDQNTGPVHENLPSHWSVQKGDLTLPQIQQLVNFSTTDPVIRMYGPSEHQFDSVKNYQEWLHQEPRSIYALIDDTKNLYGIIWFENLRLPEGINYSVEFNHEEYTTTIAQAMYGKARGKGLAFPFVTIAIEDYLKANRVNLWISTRADNLVDLAMLRSIGIMQVVIEPDDKKLVYFIVNADDALPALRQHEPRREYPPHAT